MTTRGPRINPLLATVAVLLLVALAVSLAHSETGSGPPERSPERSGFHIQGTDLGVFLVNSRTGDTWKWFYNRDEGSMGWQYHAVPAPIGGNTLQSQIELIEGQREIIERQRELIERQRGLIERQREDISTIDKRIEELEAECT